MTTQLATMQQLRSSEFGEYPPNLEPGQIAFNIAQGNFDASIDDYNIYMFVGNGGDLRITEDGTVIFSGGTAGKGWVRYALSGGLKRGGTVHGDLTVLGSVFKVEASNTNKAQLVVPNEGDTPASGNQAGGIRWNTASSILQAWNGAKWDTTSKVSVSTTAPVNPSNGDLWLDNTNAATPTLYCYVVPQSGAAAWVPTFGTAANTALQPGNGVTSNDQNQIDLINPGDY
jgi:hypothetical protein